MPGYVYVRIDPARQDRELREVVNFRAGGPLRLRANAGDFAAVDHYADIMQNMSGTVDDRARTQNNSLILCKCACRDHEGYDQCNASQPGIQHFRNAPNRISIRGILHFPSSPSCEPLCYSVE